MALSEIELDALAAGDDVATDVVTARHYQYVKMTYGAAGTVNEVTSTTTNPFPVALSDTDNAVLDAIAAAQLPDGHNVTVDNASIAVTNAGTFAVQISDTSFAVADGSALGEGILIQGDDGTDRKNINVDATTGDVQVDVTNTVTVDGSGVTQPVSGTVTETNSGAILADTASMDTNLGTVAGAVAAGQMQVDIVADGAGLLTTSAHDAAFGTAGTADAQVRSVQGIAGGTAIEVDLGANNDVTCTLDAETTKVIGTVNIAAGQSITADLGANNDVTVTSGTVTANLGATDNAVLDQIEVNTSYGDSVGGGTEAAALRVTLANDSTGVLSVDDNGGSLTVDGTVTANLSATDNAVLDTIAAQQLPATSGGISTVYRDEDIDETAVAAKASAGQVYWIHCINLDATPVYLHFYDVAQGSVTVGTTAEKMSFAVPSQGDANGAGFTMNFPHGVEFSTAITIACTTTIGGTAGPGANEVILNVGYE